MKLRLDKRSTIFFIIIINCLKSRSSQQGRVWQKSKRKLRPLRWEIYICDVKERNRKQATREMRWRRKKGIIRKQATSARVSGPVGFEISIIYLFIYLFCTLTNDLTLLVRAEEFRELILRWWLCIGWCHTDQLGLQLRCNWGLPAYDWAFLAKSELRNSVPKISNGKLLLGRNSPALNLKTFLAQWSGAVIKNK